MLSQLKEYALDIEWFIAKQFTIEGPFLLPAASIALLSYKNSGSRGNALFIALNGYVCSNLMASALISNLDFGLKPDLSDGFGPVFVASAYFATQQYLAQNVVKYITTNYIDKKYDYSNNGWKDSGLIFAVTAVCTFAQLSYTHFRNYKIYKGESKEEQTPSGVYKTGFFAAISTTLLLLTYRRVISDKTKRILRSKEETQIQPNINK